ncbi:MAG: type II toxin-antitoxin system HicB family antitoxin [Clostridiales bacterium]|nr:type II toxin-antitoxin system HicB family antitoxin [Clostridiales bacterium]
MANELTPAEIERRFAEINALPAETPTQEEAKSLAAAEAMDDGTTVSLEAFQRDLEEYSGRLVLRIPRSLHKSLKEAAALEGVSLNQYMLYKLSR